MLKYLSETFKTNQKKIDEWFLMCEEMLGDDPVYASVDIRNAGYKVAPVDTNIFPAGFNNLCPSYRREAGRLFKEYFTKYYPEARRIMVLAEEHTRNLFYFEHLHSLTTLLREAGFEVEIGSLSPDLSEDRTEVTTAEQNSIVLWKAKVVGYMLTISPWKPDVILVNNDFSGGIPAPIKKIVQDMIPTPCIGWFNRKKSDHFNFYEKLAHSFAEHIGFDPWLISGKFLAMGEVNFSDQKSMEQLAVKVDTVISEIAKKHKEYGIESRPYVFVKNDAGTYGMAVMTAESGDELLHLNKKDRTKMKVGKGKRPVTEVIIQEGLPTVDRFQDRVAEPVVYLVHHQVCGGFFRVNEQSDDRSNLNQPGMKFTKLCLHEELGYANTYAKDPINSLKEISSVYNTISRIASFAAGVEIKKVHQLNAQMKEKCPSCSFC